MSWQGRLAVVLLMALCAVARPWAASASLHFSDEALALSSAAAVRGRVAAVRAAWDPQAGAIYTFVTIAVARSWGLRASHVVVKQLGGVVGSTALRIGGEARFAPGEDVLVFLAVRPRDQTLYVAGFEHGKWTLGEGTADRLPAATREVGGVDPRTPPTRELRPATELEALAALAGTRVRAGAVRLLADVADVAPGETAFPQFMLLTPATPARWHEADTATPVAVDSQIGGHPQLPGGGIAQGVAATALWSRGGALQLAPGVFRGPRCFSHAEPVDGRISITYGDPCGEIADSSLTLAVGGAYFSASDIRVVQGVPFWKITAGMIVTDGVAAKFAGMSTGCYADLLAHELGHAIGFGHATTQPSLMFPTLPVDCAARGTGLPLQLDERIGLSVVYPVAGPPPPSVPNGLGAAVSGDTVTLFWGEPLWGPRPTSYRLEAGSAPGLADYGVADLPGTSLVRRGVPNGQYHVRVRSVAAGVTGAPTPDVYVEVGGPPPGPPTDVSISVAAGGLVQVSWSAPATGCCTGYEVLVGSAPGHTALRIPVATTSFGATGVPAGTYHVRVVALNGASAGPPSAEATLVVP